MKGIKDNLHSVISLLLVGIIIFCCPLASYAQIGNSEILSLAEENAVRPSDTSIAAELQNRFSSVDIGIDKWDCKISVLKNDFDFLPEDYTIAVDWTYRKVSAADLIENYTNHVDKPYTDLELDIAREKLCEYQRSIYRYLAEKYPDYKFSCGFCHYRYRYPNIEVDLLAYKFLQWTNYSDAGFTDSNRYAHSKKGDFRWNLSENRWGDSDDHQNWDIFLKPVTAKLLSSVYQYAEYKKYNSDLVALYGDDEPRYYFHFLAYGMKEGRRGSAEFDPKAYRANNKDLDEAYGDDWAEYYWHYLQHGKSEGRKGK
jgi:hypothetical protein